jgi:hypothetical protein
MNKTIISKSLVLLAITSFLVGCGNANQPSGAAVATPTPPAVITVDPKDYARFDKIMGQTADQRFKEQVKFLQEKGHDLKWYPDTLQIEQHNTVQLLYFSGAKRVVSLCSGSFVSQGEIMTAGHCNEGHPEWSREPLPMTCQGDLVFAYKASKDAPISYYECDRIVRNTFIREDKDASGIHDMALFETRIPNPAFVRRGSVWRGGTHYADRDLAYLQGITKDLIQVALVVDPPADYAPTFASAYDIVISRVVNTHNGLWTGLTSQNLVNHTQPGNSGGPLYLLEDSNVMPEITENFKVVFVDEGPWNLASPLYGSGGNYTIGSYPNWTMSPFTKER